MKIQLIFANILFLAVLQKVKRVFTINIPVIFIGTYFASVMEVKNLNFPPLISAFDSSQTPSAA